VTFKAAPATQRFWSVTSLIKLGLGTSDALVNHSINSVAASALDSARVVEVIRDAEGRDAAVDWLKRRRYVSLNAARDRGTDIHKAAEAMALGMPVTIDDELLPWVEQLRGWLDVHKPTFLMAEAPVYNTQWRYAGTLDGIVELYGRRLLYDIKTTQHTPSSGRSRPPFPEVALQCCAYSRATEVGLLSERRYSGGKRYYIYDPAGTHEPMPAVDGALCIVVSPEDCFAVPVRIDDSVWDSWMSVIRCAMWTLQGSTDLFGPPLPA
jgi:hypothetical protein